MSSFFQVYFFLDILFLIAQKRISLRVVHRVFDHESVVVHLRVQVIHEGVGFRSFQEVIFSFPLVFEDDVDSIESEHGTRRSSLSEQNSLLKISTALSKVM